MRSLHGLLAGFGLVMGLIGVGIASWAESSKSVRVDYGFGSYEAPTSDVHISMGSVSPYLIALGPLVGALLGWLCAITATHWGWQLSRSN